MALAFSIFMLVVSMFAFGFMAALTIGEIRHLSGERVIAVHPVLLIASGILPIITLIVVLTLLPIAQ